MSETIRRLEKAWQAAAIARAFEELTVTKPEATLNLAYTWENVERLAKRLELMPDALAIILVNWSAACSVDETLTALPAPPTHARRSR